MDPVAQPPAHGVTRNRDRPHDLADLTLPAEEVAPPRHPRPCMAWVRVELERAGIDCGLLGPGDRHLAGNDVEDVQPPGRSRDDLIAAVAPDRHVVLDDRVDAHAHQVHGPILASGRHPLAARPSAGGFPAECNPLRRDLSRPGRHGMRTGSPGVRRAECGQREAEQRHRDTELEARLGPG